MGHVAVVVVADSAWTCTVTLVHVRLAGWPGGRESLSRAGVAGKAHQCLQSL